MRIVCISDTHNKYHVLTDKLPNGDILIHAGDLVTHGTVEEIQQFILWFQELPYQYKIFVGGNHDGALEHQRAQITIPDNIIYLENSATIINNTKIWGSPVSPPYRSFGFMWSDERRCELYKTIPSDCQILINHSPPFGTLDKVTEGSHVGCQFLAEHIARVKPKIVICGHIHEAYGYIVKDNILYINPSLMTRKYEPINQAIVIDYDERTQTCQIVTNPW